MIISKISCPHCGYPLDSRDILWSKNAECSKPYDDNGRECHYVYDLKEIVGHIYQQLTEED